MTGQRVSNWVATGTRTFCPRCGSGAVVVAYFVYENETKGWEYKCPDYGAKGPGEMKYAP